MHLNNAMREFEINTPLRMAAFLAQLCHESAEFRYMEELANGSAYDDNTNLGNHTLEAKAAAKRNKNTTAGRFYKGHGPIQITGFNNHKRCGEALGLDLINNPELLTIPEHGCRGAAWFWRTGAGLNLSNRAKTEYEIPVGCDLNDYADRGQLEHITVAVNGGLNGRVERMEYYARALEVLR